MTTLVMKPCITCGQPSPGSRCADCQPGHELARGTREERGYDHRWRELSRRARKAQPWCTTCGAQQDLTTDHSEEAWRRKAARKVIRVRDVTVLCRSCNSRKGAAR